MNRRARAGFALPLTLFLISLLTLMLTAAFTKVQADRRVADSSGANVDAMAIAKAALQTYLGTKVTRPADGDSVRINITGGYGDVVARVVRRPADTLANWLFVVRAVGHVIEPAQGADPQAVRTIAQYASWQTGQIDVTGALTTAYKIDDKKAGKGVKIDGNDLASCGPAQTTKPALHVASGGDPSPVPTNGSANGLFGSPLVVSTTNALGVATSTNIDWQSLIGGEFTPKYTSAGTVRTGDNSYPTQIVTGNATITNNSGTGLLIVTGDLTFAGAAAAWSGVILVGGTIQFPASFSWVYGTIVAGLNELTTGAPNSHIELAGNNTSHIYIYYDSCQISQTMASLTGFAPITNGWVDNWATY